MSRHKLPPAMNSKQDVPFGPPFVAASSSLTTDIVCYLREILCVANFAHVVLSRDGFCDNGTFKATECAPPSIAESPFKALTGSSFPCWESVV